VGILESTLGHRRIQEALLNALAQGRLPSQFLFVGPEGVGKRRFAWGMAEVLLCQRPPSQGQACGLCSSCIKIRGGFHENVLLIEPEKNLIKLEKARDIQDFLSLAQNGGARVIIVNDAHALNAQASNSLLKIFEEPPPNTYFFFITHRWTQVLPTIRSRSTRVSFAPLSDSDLLRWADGNQDLVRWARGSVKELLEQKDEARGEVRQEALRLFQRWVNEPDFFVLGDWREAVKDRDKLLLLSRYWPFLLRDFMTSVSESGSDRPGDGVLALPGLRKFPLEKVWDLWERGLSLEPGLLGYRDPVLLVEEWLTPLFLKNSGVS
jgi:DNA polymerase-3 subunit delta'